jgi:hypothetical protein
MTQVIIFSNANGGVSVCLPTEKTNIESVLKNDCPIGAIIVDDSTLPQGADGQFFDAWELSGDTITVNLEKARSIKLFEYNEIAIKEAEKRQLNKLAGIENIINDNDFIDNLTSKRLLIQSASTTSELVEI